MNYHKGGQTLVQAFTGGVDSPRMGRVRTLSPHLRPDTALHPLMSETCNRITGSSELSLSVCCSCSAHCVEIDLRQ